MPVTLSRRAFLAGSVLAPAALTGCGGGSGSPTPTATRSVAYGWSETLTDTISATRLGPPMNARAIAIVHTAMYDAWAAYDAKAVGTRLGAALRRPESERTPAAKAAAVSFAAYRALVDLYPSEKARFTARMTQLGYNPADTSLDATTPAGVGNRAAQALLEFRHGDGSNQANSYADTTGYVPINTPDTVNDPSQWQPLRFANGQAPGFMAPHWGGVTPFSLSSGAQLRPAAPPAYGTPEYRRQAQELIDIMRDLNDTRKATAEYWADGPRTVTPPGHWQLHARFVSRRDGHTLDEDVVMFFLLGNAVMDASIVCWDCKRAYNTSRPITAIRALYAGQQVPSFTTSTRAVVMVDGSRWMPYQSPNFVTPPFPEYTSGHSTFSAASAEVLKRFTGSDRFGNSVVIPPASLSFEPTAPGWQVSLAWPTFSEAADQAGMSRRFGGIHFEAGDMEARRCGRLIGEAVWNKGMAYVNGTA